MGRERAAAFLRAAVRVGILSTPPVDIGEGPVFTNPDFDDDSSERQLARVTGRSGRRTGNVGNGRFPNLDDRR